MDGAATLGILAGPAAVAGLIAVFRPMIERWLSTDAIPPIALLLGIGYTLLAWGAGVVEASNGLVAALLGISVGLAAAGAREVTRHYAAGGGARRRA